MDGDREGTAQQAEFGAGPRWVAYLVAVVAVVAVLAPMFRSPAPDGFPLSTYPMFARDRGDRTWLDTAIGRTQDGAVRRLSAGLISGSDEPVLAAATVTRALVADDEQTLCGRVAQRVADRGLGDVTSVQVVSERHDLDRFTPDDPLERVVHADCRVAP